MTVETITLQLPESIYLRLQEMAQAIQQPLEQVLLQTIHSNLPPEIAILPEELQAEVRTWGTLSDQALWQLTQETVPETQIHRQRKLLEKNAQAELTVREQAELVQLRSVVDRLVLRRSFALALLKWRGHTLPMPNPFPLAHAA